MKKTEIIATKEADDNHVVHTLKGGPDHAYRRKPCGTCPWRVDAVGEFPAEAFRHSTITAYDMGQSEFACHSSGIEKPATCAGYLLNGSAHNLLTRVKDSQGKYDWDSITDGGVELFSNYRAMAIANGVGPDEECLKRCRD